MKSRPTLVSGAGSSVHVVWINKSEWLKPGPIVYMSLLNAHSIAQQGISTSLFISEGKPSDTEIDLVRQYGIDPIPTLQIHRVRNASGWRSALGRPVYRAALAEIRRRLKTGQRVLVITREIGVLPALGRLRQCGHGRLIVLFEAHDFFARLDHIGKRRLADYRKCLAERWYLPKTDGIVCLTTAQQALYRQAMPGLRSHLSPLGCIHPASAADAETRRRLRTIAYVGHLHSYKGSQLLVKLATHLRDSSIRIIVFGASEEQKARFRRTLAKRDAAHSMEFHSFLAPAELHRHLSTEASLGIVPLQDTFYSRYLTCPVKALDALAHGLPVVASDLDSTREVLGLAALYCPPDDATAFAEAASLLLDDPVAYRIQADRALARAAELRWPARAKAMLRFAQGPDGPFLPDTFLSDRGLAESDAGSLFVSHEDSMGLAADCDLRDHSERGATAWSQSP